MNELLLLAIAFVVLTLMGVPLFVSVDGPGADIQTDKVIFFSKNHEKCSILKNFMFVRRFQAQCQENLALGFHSARHATFDSGNGDR